MFRSKVSHSNIARDICNFRRYGLCKIILHSLTVMNSNCKEMVRNEKVRIERLLKQSAITLASTLNLSEWGVCQIFYSELQALQDAKSGKTFAFSEKSTA